MLFRYALLSTLAFPLGLSAATPSVSIVLGASNTETGLSLKEPDGGATTVVTKGNSSARSTAPPAGKTGQFMYFATDPAFANNGSVANLWITVEYFDEGTGAFRLEYDAQPDPNNPNPDIDAYTVSNPINNGLIYKYDSKQWLSFTFALNNVYFGKRQPGGSDFRLNDWTIDNNFNPVDGATPLIVRKVTVSTTAPTAFHIKYASSPAKIDGVLDDPVWQSAQTFLLNRAAQDVIRPSKWTGTNDYSAVARFAWDKDFLYASFDTYDDTPRVSLDDPSQAWNGDGAEIFFGFDQSNPGRTTYIDGTDFHIMMSAGPNPTVEIADRSGIIWTNDVGQPFPPSEILAVKDHAASQPKGYVLEAKIPWVLLVNPTVGTTNKVVPGQLAGFSIFGNNGHDPAAPAQEEALSLTERPGPSHNPSSWDTVQMDAAAAATPPAIQIAGAQPNVTITFTGTLQSAPTLPGTFTAVAGATSPYKVPLTGNGQFYRAVLGGADVLPTPTCSTAGPSTAWLNTSFADQTGTFTVEWDATPSQVPIDCVMGLSAGPATAWSTLACIARFYQGDPTASPPLASRIDARNDNGYSFDNVIPYSANVTYHFRMVVNIPAHTYSTYVTPAGGTEILVGKDYAFRTEQKAVTHLNNLSLNMDTNPAVVTPAGANTVCNFRLAP